MIAASQPATAMERILARGFRPSALARSADITRIAEAPSDSADDEPADGLGGRRDFQLLESDEVGLAARGLKWETIDDNGRRWLLIREFQLPAGFSVPSTTIALDIPPSYPSGEIDMFYCCPHLTRQGGGTIAQADVPQNVAGVSFQRWSRHRGGGSPWRPGVDNVLTHLALVEAALLREVER